jgi:septal ring factor EnvC (AmiA/AmiB activator)
LKIAKVILQQELKLLPFFSDHKWECIAGGICVIGIGTYFLVNYCNKYGSKEDVASTFDDISIYKKASTKRVSDALLGLQKESDNLDAGIEDATLKTIALLTTGGRLRATAQKAIETNQSHVQNMHGILTGLQLTVEQTGESFNNGLQSLAGELDNSASPLLQSYQLVEQQLKASQARTEEHLQNQTNLVAALASQAEKNSQQTQTLEKETTTFVDLDEKRAQQLATLSSLLKSMKDMSENMDEEQKKMEGASALVAKLLSQSSNTSSEGTSLPGQQQLTSDFAGFEVMLQLQGKKQDS